jgi:hypothetical protein
MRTLAVRKEIALSLVFSIALGAREVVAGDFNGDGYEDLVVGAPHETVGSAVEAGSAFVMYGSATGIATTPASTFILPLIGLEEGALRPPRHEHRGRQLRWGRLRRRRDRGPGPGRRREVARRDRGRVAWLAVRAVHRRRTGVPPEHEGHQGQGRGVCEGPAHAELRALRVGDVLRGLRRQWIRRSGHRRHRVDQGEETSPVRRGRRARAVRIRQGTARQEEPTLAPRLEGHPWRSEGGRRVGPALDRGRFRRRWRRRPRRWCGSLHVRRRLRGRVLRALRQEEEGPASRARAVVRRSHARRARRGQLHGIHVRARGRRLQRRRARRSRDRESRRDAERTTVVRAVLRDDVDVDRSGRQRDAPLEPHAIARERQHAGEPVFRSGTRQRGLQRGWVRGSGSRRARTERWRDSSLGRRPGLPGHGERHHGRHGRRDRPGHGHDPRRQRRRRSTRRPSRDRGLQRRLVRRRRLRHAVPRGQPASTPPAPCWCCKDRSRASPRTAATSSTNRRRSSERHPPAASSSAVRWARDAADAPPLRDQ